MGDVAHICDAENSVAQVSLPGIDDESVTL